MRSGEKNWRLAPPSSLVGERRCASRRGILVTVVVCILLAACQSSGGPQNEVLALSDLVLAAPGNQLILHSNHIEVVTLPQRWAYAATLSLEDLFFPGPVVLSIKARATEGALAFGLLNQDETEFLTETVLPKSAGPVTVELGIPALSKASRLMVRNGDQGTSSRGLIYGIFMRSGVTGSRLKEIKLKQTLKEKYPALSDPAATDWQKVSALRSWVYEVTDLAASRSTLLPAADSLARLSVAETLESLERNEGGLWCDGTAWVLRQVLKQFGYTSSKVLGYGTPTALTHSVLLVDLQIDGRPKTVILDPYFNISYLDEGGHPLDYFEILDLLRREQADRVRVEDHSELLEKDVIISSKDGSYSGWVSVRSGFTSLSSCEAVATNSFRCRLRPNLLGFSEGHVLMPDTRAFLRSQGYGEDLKYLLLFPFAVSDDRGYRDDPAKSPFLCRAQMVIKNFQRSEVECQLGGPG